MKTGLILSLGGSVLVALAGAAVQPESGYGAKRDDAKLIAMLPKSRLTLEAGIRQAATGTEAPISAKFELEDKGELSLSVYVAEKGLGADAEHNILKELAGAPDSEKWTPETEVFKDVEHVARSAEQLTIMALSKLSLTDAIAKAQRDHAGTVYSVTPTLRDRTAVLVVLVADHGKTFELGYDALTGEAVRGMKK